MYMHPHKPYLGGLAHVVGQHPLLAFPSAGPFRHICISGGVPGQGGRRRLLVLLVLLLEEEEAALVGEPCEARGGGGEVLVEVELSWDDVKSRSVWGHAWALVWWVGSSHKVLQCITGQAHLVQGGRRQLVQGGREDGGPV